MSDSKRRSFEQYGNYVRKEVRARLGKNGLQKVTSGNIKKRLSEDHYVFPPTNKTEVNVLYTKTHLLDLGDIYGNQWGEQIGVRSLAGFLNENEETVLYSEYRWELAILAKIFELDSEQVFRAKTRTATAAMTPYETFFKAQIEQANVTYEWEACLMLLVHNLHKNAVTKLTICIDDLHLIFKIMPTILDFLNRGNSIHFIYAPRHGYSLMASKEFIALWRLGVRITVLDFRESLSDWTELGFIFNWHPSDGELSTGAIYQNMVEMIRIRTSSFDRYPFSTFINYQDTGEIFNSVINVLRKLGSPYSRDMTAQKYGISMLSEEDYTGWFKERFSAARNSMYNGCEYEFEYMDVNELYYRHTSFVRYKVFQAYKILDRMKNSAERVSSHVFRPHNLFSNAGGLYPTNPPIVEFNPIRKRWEVAEGHHRILAQMMISPGSKVRVLKVTNIGESAFNETQNPADIILNDWQQALNKITDLHRVDSQVYQKRSIEAITHIIDNSIYDELAKEVERMGLLSSNYQNETEEKSAINELVRFSHGRYKHNR